MSDWLKYVDQLGNVDLSEQDVVAELDAAFKAEGIELPYVHALGNGAKS